MSPHKNILKIVLFATVTIFSLADFSSASAATYTASLSTSGAINLDVSASGNGANVIADEVTVTSTCPSGYTLSIKGPSDTTLYKNGDNTSIHKIDASSGTKDAPASILGNNLGTWGFTTGENISASSNFIGLTNSIVDLKTTLSATSVSGEKTSVYYGVSVDNDTAPGLYTMAESTTGADDNVITYLLTTSLDCTSYKVAFNPTSTATGTSISGTGTMPDQRISEDATTNLGTNSFTAPTSYIFDGWNTAQDGSGTPYSNGASVTNLTTVGNTITLYAQWKKICLPGNVCYEDNGAASPTRMGDEAVDSSATEVVLWASNFKRNNYGFAGWNTSADGTGTSYGPNETIDDATTLATIQSNGLMLYAVWVAPAKDSLGNDLTFQTANLLTTTLEDNSTLASKSNGYITALKDERDDDVYAIAKLADGNYWMIENLRLDYDAAHNSDGSLAQGYGGVFVGLAEPETADHSFTNSVRALSNSLYKSDDSGDIAGVNGATLSDIGKSNNPESRIPHYRNDNTNTNSAINSNTNVTNMTSTDQNIYSYGNYYSWAAAKANTKHLDTEANSEAENTSLCPSGWRLPRGGDKTRIEGGTSDYYTLGLAIIGQAPANYSSSTSPNWRNNSNTEGADASKAIRSFPNNYIYSGNISASDSSVAGRGVSAYYWSSTAKSSNGTYPLTLSKTSVYPGTFGSIVKYLGGSIRCLISPSV